MVIRYLRWRWWCFFWVFWRVMVSQLIVVCKWHLHARMESDNEVKCVNQRKEQSKAWANKKSGLVVFFGVQKVWSANRYCAHIMPEVHSIQCTGQALSRLNNNPSSIPSHPWLWCTWTSQLMLGTFHPLLGVIPPPFIQWVNHQEKWVRCTRDSSQV